QIIQTWLVFLFLFTATHAAEYWTIEPKSRFGNLCPSGSKCQEGSPDSCEPGYNLEYKTWENTWILATTQNAEQYSDRQRKKCRES
ncbi:hypothetical protein PFISCL1PPCAC_7595, partial [Pristionchus fissidentatus]